MKKDYYQKMVAYIIQNYTKEDIEFAFLKYNNDIDLKDLSEFIRRTTISEIVEEFISNCNNNGDNVIEVLNSFINDFNSYFDKYKNLQIENK